MFVNTHSTLLCSILDLLLVFSFLITVLDFCNGMYSLDLFLAMVFPITLPLHTN